MYRRLRPSSRPIARSVRSALLTWAVVSATAPTVRGLEFALDFSQESYIFSDAKARDAARAAANDLGAAVTSTLNAISTDVWQGSYQSTTATFTFDYNYLDPTIGPGQTAAVPAATAPFDTVKILFRTRAITSPEILGEGGPWGLGHEIALSGQPAQGPIATSNTAGKSQTAYRRGNAGPAVGTLRNASGLNWNGVPLTYAIEYGVGGGTIWLDADADDDNVIDEPGELQAKWHYDHTTAPPPGKFDVYSMVLHEMMHVLGIGGSATWESLRNGNTWLGPEASGLAGSGANLIANDHIRASVQSLRLRDGAPQEVVMDPTLSPGTRKELTLLDLAFLRDLGWETVTPTYPGDFDGNGLVDGSDFTQWAGDFGHGVLADADLDGDSDGADFLIWQANRGQGAASNALALTAVPEPSTLILTLLWAGWIKRPRRANAISRRCAARPAPWQRICPLAFAP